MSEWIGPLISAVAVIASVVVGAWLSRSSARQQAQAAREEKAEDRLWQFRKDAYTAILAKLAEAAREQERIATGYHESEHPDAYDASKDRRERDAVVWSAWSACREQFERNRLVISPEFTEAFKAIRKELAAIDEDQLPPVLADQIEEAFSGGHRRLLSVALAEIRPSEQR
ncbi:hypothetical protein [Palleronia abyssalis]|uniref:Uncharacterized protein n=1 Tax=Palleronia abyssalis TaxID=1501240 RepID=A0A2R8BY54_9RHOB|nr:hypothetical protein [Palleronia abyssalis]SPJ25059.1 hypothetical protein PAA8504_02902 [Palleronia abyssalis]